MKKKLVEAGGVDPYICPDSGKFYADETMILTPGAKDELGKRGVAIVHGPMPEPAKACAAQEPCAQSANDLLVAVAAMVKDEFGVEDPEQLKAITCQAVKTIKENI